MQLYKLCDRDMTAKLIRTDGTVEVIEPKNGEAFTIGEAINLIGSNWLQQVNAWEDGMMLLTEESGVRNGKFNFDASALATSCHIVGNAIYCHTSMLR